MGCYLLAGIAVLDSHFSSSCLCILQVPDVSLISRLFLSLSLMDWTTWEGCAREEGWGRVEGWLPVAGERRRRRPVGRRIAMPALLQAAFSSARWPRTPLFRRISAPHRRLLRCRCFLVVAKGEERWWRRSGGCGTRGVGTDGVRRRFLHGFAWCSFRSAVRRPTAAPERRPYV